jgi:hypothetical protein
LNNLRINGSIKILGPYNQSFREGALLRRSGIYRQPAEVLDDRSPEELRAVRRMEEYGGLFSASSKN